MGVPRRCGASNNVDPPTEVPNRRGKSPRGLRSATRNSRPSRCGGCAPDQRTACRRQRNTHRRFLPARLHGGGQSATAALPSSPERRSAMLVESSKETFSAALQTKPTPKILPREQGMAKAANPVLATDCPPAHQSGYRTDSAHPTLWPQSALSDDTARDCHFAHPFERLAPYGTAWKFRFSGISSASKFIAILIVVIRRLHLFY